MRQRRRWDSQRYGTVHRALRRRYAVLVASGIVECARCGKPSDAGEQWHLDHDDVNPSKYLGPSHVACNCATSTHRAERNQRITSRNW